MKIINSHYIPLQEPYTLFMAPNHRIYTQIGTLAVIEEKPKKGGKYGIMAHHHPIVISATVIDDDSSVDDDSEGVEVQFIPVSANGEVLYEYELKQCHQLCKTDHRELPLEQFNAMVLASYYKPDESPVDVGDLIDTYKICGIHIDFPEEEEQVITLSTIAHGDMLYLQSDIVGLFFMVPFGKLKGGKAQSEVNKVLLEFVNQARAYLKVNPNYHFRFKGSYEGIAGAIDELNNELNDYLVRKT